MVAPTFPYKTGTQIDTTNVRFGAPELNYVGRLLDGSHATDRIQAKVIEGLSQPYNAFIRPEGANYVVRDYNHNILHSSTSAHDALLNLCSQGGNLHIGGPPGTVYNTTSVMFIPNNTIVDVSAGVTIKGAGDAGALIDVGGGVMVHSAHPLIRNVDHATTGNDYIIIRGGIWDGNVLDTTGGTVSNGTTASITANLDFFHCEFVWIDHVVSKNSQSECIKVRDSSHAFITNNYTKHSRLTSDNKIGKAGIHTGETGDSVIVANNVSEDSGGEGIGSYYDSGRILISNNVSKYVTYGRNHILQEGNAGTSEWVENTIISNNTVLAAWYGINIISGKGIKITNNNISTAIPMNPSFAFEGVTRNEGIRISGDCHKIDINNNYIHDCQFHGIWLTNTITDSKVSQNMIINPGMAASNTYDGIFINPSANKTNMKICDNFIRDDTATPKMRYGIGIDANAINLFNTWIYNNQIYNQVSGNPTINISYGTNGRFRDDSRFFNNTGFNPYGKITNPFNNTHAEVGIQKGSNTSFTFAAAPTASTEYVVVMSPIAVWSSGGTAVAITIKDKVGGTTITPGTPPTTLVGTHLGIGQTINFGAFSGAPTVHVVGL